MYMDMKKWQNLKINKKNRDQSCYHEKKTVQTKSNRDKNASVQGKWFE